MILVKKNSDRLSYYTDERNQYVVNKNILKYIYYLLVVAIILFL